MLCGSTLKVSRFDSEYYNFYSSIVLVNEEFVLYNTVLVRIS